MGEGNGSVKENLGQVAKIQVRVRLAREAAGLDAPRERGEKLFGAGKSTVTNYENGTTPPSYEYLAGLVGAGVNPDYLLRGVPPVLRMQKEREVYGFELIRQAVEVLENTDRLPYLEIRPIPPAMFKRRDGENNGDDSGGEPPE